MTDCPVVRMLSGEAGSGTRRAGRVARLPGIGGTCSMKRRRAGYLVLGVLVAHLVVISVQVDTFSRYERAALRHLRPAVRGAASGELHGGRRTWPVERLRFRCGARMRRRSSCRSRSRGSSCSLQTQDALVQQAQSLERLLELDRTVDLMTLSARVIGVDATPWFRTVTVDRGMRDGVEAELAVIAPGGVVGRVVGTPWNAGGKGATDHRSERRGRCAHRADARARRGRRERRRRVFAHGVRVEPRGCAGR